MIYLQFRQQMMYMQCSLQYNKEWLMTVQEKLAIGWLLLTQTNDASVLLCILAPHVHFVPNGTY